MSQHHLTAFALTSLLLSGCGDPAPNSSAEATFGPSPNLPAPQNNWISTVSVATAVGWPPGAKPKAADGLTVTAFASGLDHPRTVYTLPNGDVLVAESNGPPKPDDGKGVKGWAQHFSEKGGSGYA
jgi:glucose/arabinose dehydrogenase